MRCPVCEAPTDSAFNATVLRKYEASYRVCPECEYLFAESPVWLDEAYSSAIAAADTGLMARNISLSLKVSSVLYWVMGDRGDGRYLDVAGGYGVLTRLMRDIGFDFYWTDPFCENLVARGFEFGPQLGPCSAVTAMEVLEHVQSPLEFLKQGLTKGHADTIFFTTELYGGIIPSSDWWYYTFETGQHIGFFTAKTLQKLADLLGMTFMTAHGLHVLTRKHLSRTCFQRATHPHLAKLSYLWTRRVIKSRTLRDHNQMMEAN